MPPLRVGFVGAGFIAKFQVRAMAQIHNMELAGVTSRTHAHAVEVAALARQLGVGDAKVYASISEMAPHVDAIAIYAPNYLRIAMMEEIVVAVKAGAPLKGIICEKPLGRNIAEARRLVELADQIAIPTAYFENQVFMKPLRAQLTQLRPKSPRWDRPFSCTPPKNMVAPMNPGFGTRRDKGVACFRTWAVTALRRVGMP